MTDERFLIFVNYDKKRDNRTSEGVMKWSTRTLLSLKSVSAPINLEPRQSSDEGRWTANRKVKWVWR